MGLGCSDSENFEVVAEINEVTVEGTLYPVLRGCYMLSPVVNGIVTKATINKLQGQLSLRARDGKKERKKNY